jgi:hypothetical protein
MRQRPCRSAWRKHRTASADVARARGERVVTSAAKRRANAKPKPAAPAIAWDRFSFELGGQAVTTARFLEAKDDGQGGQIGIFFLADLKPVRDVSLSVRAGRLVYKAVVPAIKEQEVAAQECSPQTTAAAAVKASAPTVALGAVLDLGKKLEPIAEEITKAIVDPQRPQLRSHRKGNDVCVRGFIAEPDERLDDGARPVFGRRRAFDAHVDRSQTGFPCIEDVADECRGRGGLRLRLGGNGDVVLRVTIQQAISGEAADDEARKRDKTNEDAHQRCSGTATRPVAVVDDAAPTFLFNRCSRA